MKFDFPYKRVKYANGTLAYQPSIPLTFLTKDCAFDTIGLLDSGANISAIPRDVAEVLGLHLTPQDSLSFGIGGKVRSAETKITMRIGNGKRAVTFKLPVKVILDDVSFPILIGRKTFFDKFDVHFSQKQKKITLSL
ncbi:MAG: retropepsin-like aspartic protease [Nanoarchaeota archaeon]